MSSADDKNSTPFTLTSDYLATLLDGVPTGILVTRANGCINYINAEAERLFGYSRNELINQSVDILLPDRFSKHHSFERQKFVDTPSPRHMGVGRDLFGRRKDGSEFPLEIGLRPLECEGEQFIAASIVDITTRKKLEERFEKVIEASPYGQLLIDEQGVIQLINRSLSDIFGYSSEELLNNNMEILLPKRYRKNHSTLRESYTQSPSLRAMGAGRNLTGLHKNGTEIPIEIRLSPLETDKGCLTLAAITDISERKEYEKQLIKLAQYDPLTGLGNRTKLYKDIDFLIEHSNRKSSPFALLFGDLDHFKDINDGLGHEAGDTLLKIVARRLQRGMRRGDSAARLGGDEFVVLLQDVEKYESVIVVAEKIINKINKPIKLNGNIVHIGISIGIVLYPTDGDDAKTLLRNADSALYDVKAKGRGHYQLYRKELTEFVHNRLLLDADLRRAITNNEFELHFQPVINLNTFEITSAEALIRWNHPTRGMVYPGEFIGYAQESGLITRIDDWVINEACKTAGKWHKQGFNVKIAVNITALQFQNNNLIKTIEKNLKNYNLNADSIILEITEQMFVENTELILLQISQLKDLGVKISLDDFGVGFSSLSYIIRFAPHYLKIDRSFISKIGQGLEHDEMISTIINLHSILPMRIVAEGVENNDQRIFLEERGCNFAQGYLFSKPLPLEKFLLLLSYPLKEYLEAVQ